MRNTTNQVVTFPVPAGAPARIAEIDARFTLAVAAWEAAKDERRQAATAVTIAKQEDITAMKLALAAGEAPKQANKREAAALDRIAAAKTREEAATQLVDEVGNELARAIKEGREAWLAEAREEETAALDHYFALLNQLVAAVASMRNARRVVSFVEGFDYGARADGVCIEKNIPRAGGRLPRLKTKVINNDGEIEPLLSALATLPREEPPVRSERVSFQGAA